MSELLERGIEEKNIKKVIHALSEVAAADPGEKTDSLVVALEKIEDSGLDIWDKHDGWAYEYNSNYWTKEYYGKIFLHLRNNFSQDRFEHLRVVGKYIFADDLLSSEANETMKSDSNHKKDDRFLTHIVIGAVVFSALSVILVHVL